jgi:EAL domain-containing protein (putative c-di-GMP-specific phosphodiesterase class I)
VSDILFGNRLLVVDDELALCRIIQRTGERCGFEVTVTDDAEEFLRHARMWHATVIIMDLKMPNVDGIELLRSLAAERCAAHIIISSGSDKRILESAMRLGNERGLHMSGLLPKPVRSAELREMLLGFAKIPKDQLRAHLSEALDTKQFFLEFQPKLERASRQIKSVEALARWRHPRYGLVRPDEFIILAEETALINDVTRRVVRLAADQAADWSTANLSIDVAVNLSARDITDSDLPERLTEICREAGVSPESIILELTETGAMREAVQMMEVLTRLRLKGFRLSIDDFGTGYSSLVQLQRLPFSELKIDQSFVSKMMHDKSCQVIVEVILDLARKLEMKSVAEGVEDEETMLALFEMGCDFVQGYYISRPNSAAEITPIITAYAKPAGPSVANLGIARGLRAS